MPPTASAAPRRTLRIELAPKTLLVALLTIAAVWVLVHLLPVCLVLVAALTLVGALSPLVRRLEERRVGRKGAIAIVFGTAVGLTALLLFLMIPPLIAELKGLAEHEPDLRRGVVEWLQRSPFTSALADEIDHIDYTQLLKSSQADVLAATKRTIEIVAYLAAAIFLALYIMIDRDRLRGAVFAVIPRKHHLRFSHVLLNLETIVGGYIRGQVITCVLMTAFILALLLVCHVPNALAIAVFGGVMDVLPYIGPLLTIAPAVVAAASVSPAIAVVVFGALFCYEEFESRILIPLVYGRALRLPSSVVFFALLVGAALAGIIGALLALPLAAAIVMLIEELRVALPGETEKPEDVATRIKDQQEEHEYEKLAEQAPAEEASAIAVEIAKERKESDGER